jgi:hypothetical protein
MVFERLGLSIPGERLDPKECVYDGSREGRQRSSRPWGS